MVMKAQPVAPVPRVTLTREEAAASLGVSVAHFRRHVQPDLKLDLLGVVPVGAGRRASTLGR